ncbi:helix-turn-helix domain-containing protein [Streptacidiphilus sp. PB12-B1b]|uniref:helix-turn-helix domain-containing protein n=1 Tax=Streptacidiphilus sp. PB12-B1b TaxID=2705012 RepID=UPI0015FD1E86|nr:helix-turn-helix domain-containing protein [Streptacidiphilus sp. PB12-B1b]QMU76004.1 helix-turn-helix domain-containing protein [Streptacidiphilus sp. PB12-B1b]
MTPPFALPANLLGDPAFIAACQDRRIGDVFQLLKSRAGIYPARIARLTGFTTSRVTEYLSGTRVITNIQVIERVADGLRIPGHLLGLARRTWEADQGREDLPGTAISTETWEILDTLTRSTVSPDVLLHLEAAVLHNATLYPSTPPGRLIPGMTRQLAKLHRLLDQPQAVTARRRCVQLLGVLCGLMGLAYLDTGDTVQSSALIHLGQIAATEGEDDALTAWLLTMQSIGLFAAHRVDQASELLVRADRLAEAAPPRRRAWVTANLARAQAATGRRDAALRALDRSAAFLAVSDEIGGIDFFTGARLDGIAGTTRFLMGDHDAASALLETSLTWRDQADAKGRALLTYDLADCRVGTGDIDEACRLGHRALDIAAGSDVRPTIIRAQALQASLRPWKALPQVIRLAGRMRESHQTFHREDFAGALD